ncbi:NAD(P)-dependent malic enzyme [Marinisporobacter balticus]|uniref:Malate dehydrogenase (Oxaloacetate-decarboxylating) n=1 Tax=Marinisporobacter balticus TaxID=2018667 RepID=A0A4R2KF87_9FIRM|nr:malic enzyme-like NAD(P)-binding protein [Marinisporobacter balticus]TCO68989.1 malate dehydrogenase (oxaloacetate-decarboxylating) [Marinisporobacter balticus]
MDYSKKALEVHEAHKGKISVVSKIGVTNKDELSIAYTPGVAEPCRKIAENKEDVYKYTSKGNLVAVVSDGTAVLGLGDIGPEAALPVMEGKAVLFKAFAGVDAFPICVDTKNVDEIVDLVKKLAPTFGGINLEDISAPRCIEIEKRLKEELDIPVFHDDQHGTAIVVVAGLINALKLVNKKWEDIRIAVNGPGAAGSAIVKMLLNMNAKEILVCDRHGILEEGGSNPVKEELVKITNPNNEKGTLVDALKGADVFIGVSSPNVVTKEMVASMNKDAIVFAMANPIPEIMPALAIEAGARVVGSGRSDFANQINNVLAFPGIFKGALAVRATDINEAMKVAAANAIAEIIDESELNEEYIIPKPFDERIVETVANAVAKAAKDTGIAKL